MLKYLIYNNNLEQVKVICNSIINSFENMQLIGIATTESELVSSQKNTQINIVIFDYDNIDNKKIMNLLESFSIKIVFYNNLINLRNDKYSLYINKSSSLYTIKKKIKNFIMKIDNYYVYQKIYNILKDMNFNFKLNGTFYLIKCITYSYLNRDKYVSENLEKNVYPQIAKQFQVPVTTIKWSVIRAINDVNYSTNNISNICSYQNKITPKSLINEIINCLN